MFNFRGATRSTYIRSFARSLANVQISRAQQRKRELLQKLKKGDNSGVSPSSHKFGHLLKQLYKKTHPDLLRSTCAISASHNDKQWQVLNGILSTIKDNQYPPAIRSQMSLFLHGSSTPLQSVQLTIHTAGGDCKRSLTKSFSELFAQASLLTATAEFEWDSDYFNLDKVVVDYNETNF